VTSDDIERILADEEEIAPTPGLLASVMAAVHRESAVPPPLGFPWIRALPGILATLAACAVAIWYGVDSLSSPAAVAVLEEELRELAVLAASLGLQWVTLALGVSVVSVLLPLKLSRPARSGAPRLLPHP
jgi:hypothetical protein